LLPTVAIRGARTGTPGELARQGACVGGGEDGDPEEDGCNGSDRSGPLGAGPAGAKCAVEAPAAPGAPRHRPAWTLAPCPPHFVV